MSRNPMYKMKYDLVITYFGIKVKVFSEWTQVLKFCNKRKILAKKKIGD
jgi:hypothetical protein